MLVIDGASSVSESTLQVIYASTRLHSTFYRLFVSYDAASIRVVFISANASVLTMEEYLIEKIDTIGQIREGSYLFSRKICIAKE